MKPIKGLRTVVRTVAILALALAAVGPVLAQVGGPGQPGTPAAGIRVPVEEGDNLGSLVDLYQLDEDNIAHFFSANIGLRLDPGQKVTFPEGMQVNINGTAQNGGMEGAGSPGTTGSTDSAVQPTPTLDAGAASGTTGQGMTYQTAAGDTLGDLLDWMGFVPVPLEQLGINNGDTRSADAVPTQDAVTEFSGTGGVGVEPDDAQLVEFAELNRDLTFEQDQMLTLLPGIPHTGQELERTPTAASTAGLDQGGVTAGQIPTPSADGDDDSVIARQEAGIDVADNTQDNVDAPPAAEDAAGEGAGTGIAGQIPTPGGPADAAAAAVLAETPDPQDAQDAQASEGTYTVQSGDTLQSIAQRYGISLEQLIALNPNLLQPGDVINVPADGSGDTGAASGPAQAQATPSPVIPQTGSDTGQTGTDAGQTDTDAAPTAEPTPVSPTTDDTGQTGQDDSGMVVSSEEFTVENNETLGDLLDRYQVTENNAHAFIAVNCDLRLQEGQDINLVDGTVGQGDLTTVEGDTLCSFLELGEFERDGFADGVDDRTNQAEEDARLWQFISLNRDLRFENGEVVSAPVEVVGIPQTGAEAGQTATGAGQTGTVVGQTGTGAGQTGTTQAGGGANQAGQTAQQQVPLVCSDIPEAPAGYGYYRYRGESLPFLADRLNTSVDTLIRLNGANLVSGSIITLPGAEAPGFWNNQALRDCVPASRGE